MQPYHQWNVQPNRHEESRERVVPVQPQPKPYEKGEYQKQVDKTWSKDHQVTNADNYRDNLFGAAEKRKPVVMTFGRSSDPACRQHLEAAEKAKKLAGDKAEFVFVDLDKVDPNSAIGKYAHEQIAAKYTTPLTMVFNQGQGDDGKGVKPERPSHWQTGMLSEQALLRGIDAAAPVQKERQIKTGRENGGTTDNTTIAKRLIDESAKPFDQQKPDELVKGLDSKERAKAFWDAITAAEAMNNPKRAAQVRAMVGLALVNWGAEAAKSGDTAQAEKRYINAVDSILLAGVKDPEIYKSPSFQKALRESVLPGTAADFVLSEGEKNPKWFYPTMDEIRKDEKAQEAKREQYHKMIREQFKKRRA